eukprot:c7574_g1_i1.p2 GENE.c7574_g1_i1~~c7574_g1_i1.p2  ORF type:complete len:312 (-),score=44.75 c7574_g1_i1:93-1028(-)
MFITQAPYPVWTACGHCARLDAPKACSTCSVVRYCDENCQRADWKAFHKAECGKISKTSTAASRAVAIQGFGHRELAKNLCAQGHHDEAQAACLKAIRCFRRAEGGAVCSATGTGFHDLAVMQSRSPEHAAASLVSAERALAIRLAVGDPTLEDQIESTPLVAQRLRSLGDPRAGDLYEALLALYYRRGEVASVDYAAALGSFAIERSSFDLPRAQALGLRSLDVLRALPFAAQTCDFWDSFARTLQNLGAIMLQSGADPAACQLLTLKALEIRLQAENCSERRCSIACTARCSMDELVGLVSNVCVISML